MSYTIEELARELQFRDAAGELRPVVTAAAVKMAANRGKLNASKDERGRWVIDDADPRVQKWLEKKSALTAKAEEERKKIKAENDRKRVEENLRVENDILRREKNQLTDEKNDLAQHASVLEKQLAEANDRIAALEQQLEEQQMRATALTQQMAACEKVSDERKSLLDLLTRATAEIRHNDPKMAPVKSNRPKRTSAEQAAKDEETLQGWEQWQKTHSNPQVKDYAESLGRKRTTVNGQLARARRNRENQQEISIAE